ncbi:hypothetical protein Aduo_014882 [Ancylostoma duodenale]
MKAMLIILTTVYVITEGYRQNCRGPRSTKWVKFGETDFEYKFQCPSEYVRWEEAERRCQRYRPPAHLVSIHSEEENDFVRKLVGNRTWNFETYIGLSSKSAKKQRFEVHRWLNGGL